MLISNLRILVIDDQALVRKVVATLLASQGCNDVIEAANGVEARDIVAKSKPSLIVCDINMSPGDGFSFLRDLRSGIYGPNDIPVIFMTSSSEKPVIEKALRLGVDGYVLKPITSTNLITQIHNAIKRRQGKQVK